ncbi:hypothetical protein K438DRAFT_50789 [Mycena galopus ATCC 62051]|nr:hypothetical protein K438DRAFT_50789 [Mycena galopus ATCC 62051]
MYSTWDTERLPESESRRELMMHQATDFQNASLGLPGSENRSTLRPYPWSVFRLEIPPLTLFRFPSDSRSMPLQSIDPDNGTGLEGDCATMEDGYAAPRPHLETPSAQPVMQVESERHLSSIDAVGRARQRSISEGQSSINSLQVPINSPVPIWTSDAAPDAVQRVDPAWTESLTLKVQRPFISAQVLCRGPWFEIHQVRSIVYDCRH